MSAATQLGLLDGLDNQQMFAELTRDLSGASRQVNELLAAGKKIPVELRTLIGNLTRARMADPKVRNTISMAVRRARRSGFRVVGIRQIAGCSPDPLSTNSNVIARMVAGWAPAKACGSCGHFRPVGYFYRNRWTIDGYSSYCRACTIRNSKKYNRGHRATSRRVTRFNVLRHYSAGTMRCVLCGESGDEALTIDHIHNDGAHHRRALGGNRGSGVYAWLVRNGFPLGYRVLCFNCNCGRYVASVRKF